MGSSCIKIYTRLWHLCALNLAVAWSSKLTQQRILSEIDAAIASGRGATFSDIEFSADPRLRSNKKYAEVITPFNLHLSNTNWTGINFKNCSISGLAFSGVRLQNCTFENCLLAVRNWKSVYKDSKFIACDMKSFSFGADEPSNANTFEDVIFEKCNMQGRAIDYAKFEKSAFLNCRLDRVEFRQATISNSIFTGKLDDIVFGRDYTEKPTRIDAVSFSDATLNYCVFPNAQVSHIVAPENHKNYAIKRFKEFVAELARAIQADSNIGDVPLAPIFTAEYTAASNFGILNEDDFRELLKPKGQALLGQMLNDPIWRE